MGKHHKKKPKRFRILKIFLIFILIMGISIIGLVGGYAYNIIKDVPTIDTTHIYDTVAKSSHIYDKNNNIISDLYSEEDRELVSIDEIPEITKNAVIAVEDKTFYTHRGFNIKRIIGAVFDKITNKAESISGTSTITQQLARNIYLPSTKSERSIERKIIEAYYAYQIEQQLSKQEILEAYFNSIYYGFGCYGLKSAAETYFSKDVAELTLAESAILASLPQQPDNFALLKNEETEDTIAYEKGLYINKACTYRRDTVLDLMLEQKFISKEDYNEALKPIEEIVKPKINNKSYKFTYFKSYLLDQVCKDLQKEFSISEDDAYSMIYTQGLNIYSTIDPEIQQIILDEFADDDNFPYNYGNKETEGAMVISEVGTGKILAMVGGRNSQGDNIFNRATSSRQPGSTIKPLSVYSAALQKSCDYLNIGEEFYFTNFDIDKQGDRSWGRYITTKSLVVDEKLTIKGKEWPKNATRYYSGKNTFRSALQQSINTCAVKILYQVGFDYSKDFLKRYHISTLVEEGEYNDVNAAALALGAMTNGVTPLDMALAYATFPNEGIYSSAVPYTKIEDSEGNILIEKSTIKSTVLDTGVAWIMTDVLKSVVSNGLGYNASIRGVSVGGKTGTSDTSDNLWFCGFTPKYSAALWLGEDQNAELNASSSQAALLWGKIMSQIPDITDGEYPDQPPEVIYTYGDYVINGTYP